MPNVLLALPDVYESVTRRVAVDVTAQLARLMQLPGDTAVYLPGNTDTVPMNGGTFGDCCSKSVKYPADARLVVRYEEEADESFTLTTPVNNKEILPIFHDPIRNVTIRPVYRFVDFTVTLEYTAPNVVIAQRWVDEMRSKISMGRAEIYQDLEYHYAVPKPALAVLKAVYETMEKSAFPTGLTFEQWVIDNFRAPTKVIATLVDTDKTLAIPEHQYEVLGWFDFTTSPPKPEKDGEGNGTYTSSISYKLRYNRPTQLYMEYPFLVHQRPIPRLYRPTAPYESFKAVDRKVSVTKGSLDLAMDLMLHKRLPYIHYPDTDEWVAKTIPKERLTFYTGLLMLSKDDLRTIVDFSNLGDLKFTPYFLEYFYHQQERLFIPSKSIFEFRLYENDTYLGSDLFEFVPDTATIRWKRDLNPQKYYHFQISLKRNWYMIDRDALLGLCRYPHLLYFVFWALGVKLGGSDLDNIDLLAKGYPRSPNTLYPGEGTDMGRFPWLPRPDDVMDTGIVRTKDLDEALKHLDDYLLKMVDWRRVGPLTVMYNEILTAKG